MGADLYIEMKGMNETLLTTKLSDEETYYRDSYNSSNLLWKYGLSYWNDFPTFLTKGYELTPDNIRRLLVTLDERRDKFIIEIDKLVPEDREYFVEKDAQFRKFLKTATTYNLNIRCSI